MRTITSYYAIIVRVTTLQLKWTKNQIAYQVPYECKENNVHFPQYRGLSLILKCDDSQNFKFIVSAQSVDNVCFCLKVFYAFSFRQYDVIVSQYISQ